MQAGERSSFIRNALGFILPLAMICKMSQNIEEMLLVIKWQTTDRCINRTGRKQNDDNDKSEEELERMIAESINDILNL